MILGFTGSRKGLSPQQNQWLWDFLEREGPHLVHHGGCIGADYEVHHAATQLGYTVVVHPPINESLAVPLTDLDVPIAKVIIKERHDYLERDRAIVDASEIVIGFPDGPPRPKSGTWYTLGYAERNGKPVTIVMPDGRIAHPHRKPA